jgi:hypothetical protein
MSIPVDVEDLAEAVEQHGSRPYLLTTGEDGRPHAIHVQIALDGREVRCELGRTSARNALVRPRVSLLWPPVEQGGYSLIADGDITVGTPDSEPALGSVTITKAVLHRPAPAGSASTSCESDCLPLDV